METANLRQSTHHAIVIIIRMLSETYPMSWSMAGPHNSKKFHLKFQDQDQYPDDLQNCQPEIKKIRETGLQKMEEFRQAKKYAVSA